MRMNGMGAQLKHECNLRKNSYQANAGTQHLGLATKRNKFRMNDSFLSETSCSEQPINNDRYDHEYEEIMEYLQMIPKIIYSEILLYLSCVSCDGYDCVDLQMNSYDNGSAISEEDTLIETSDEEDENEQESRFSEINLSGFSVDEPKENLIVNESNVSSSKFYSKVIAALATELSSDEVKEDVSELFVEERNDHYALPSIKSKNGEIDDNYEEMFNADGLYASFDDSLYDVDGDSLLMTLDVELEENKRDIHHYPEDKNASKSAEDEHVIVNESTSTVLEEYKHKNELPKIDSKVASDSGAITDDYVIDQQLPIDTIDDVLPSLTAYDAHYDLLNTITSYESNNFDNYNFLFSNSDLGSDVELEDNQKDFKQLLAEIQEKLQLTKDSIEKVKTSTPQLLLQEDEFLNSAIFANGSMLEISKAMQNAKRHSQSSSEAASHRLNNAMRNIAIIFEDTGFQDEDESYDDIRERR